MNVVPTILWCLYYGLQIFLISFLVQPFFLLLIYKIVRLFNRRGNGRKGIPPKNYRFGIIITCHQETTFIPPIIDSLLKQVYPHFTVYVVADDCDISHLRFGDPRIILLKPPLALHSKTKSIEYALERFREEDEVLVIFDPDNLVHPMFLEVLNYWYNNGYKAVQGHLLPKNREGTYEILDSLGAYFSNFVDRDSRSALGLSANIWGSGVSLEKELYYKIIFDKRSQSGGFDKQMQAGIARNVHRIGYAVDAIVYDEKVEDGKNLENQRNRWIRAYFRFLTEAFDLSFLGIRRLSPNLAYFGYNLTRPPYFLQLLIAIFFIIVNFFIRPWWSVAWIIAVALFILTFIGIVMVQNPGEPTRGIRYMPLFFYHQMQAFFNIRKSKKTFLKTDHTKILYIDDLLKHDPFH